MGVLWHYWIEVKDAVKNPIVYKTVPYHYVIQCLGGETSDCSVALCFFAFIFFFVSVFLLFLFYLPLRLKKEKF
jgi:hypothetical protein